MAKLRFDGLTAYVDKAKKILRFIAVEEGGHPPIYFAVEEEVLRNSVRASGPAQAIPLLALYDAMAPAVHRAAERAFTRAEVEGGFHILKYEDFDR